MNCLQKILEDCLYLQDTMEDFEVFIIIIRKAIIIIISDKPRRGYKTLRLPLPASDYDHFVSDTSFARKTIDRIYNETPELFPAIFNNGYVFQRIDCSIY